MSVGNEFHSIPPLYEKDPLQYSVLEQGPVQHYMSYFLALRICKGCSHMHSRKDHLSN